MAFACCVNVYMVRGTRAARKENPNPNPNSHDHCDRRVEKEFISTEYTMS